MKRSAAILTAIAVLVCGYCGGYFLLMEPGFTIDPSTGHSEKGTVFRYAPKIRVPCQLPGMEVGHRHWTNRIYQPMDSFLGRK